MSIEPVVRDVDNEFGGKSVVSVDGTTFSDVVTNTDVDIEVAIGNE